MCRTKKNQKNPNRTNGIIAAAVAGLLLAAAGSARADDRHWGFNISLGSTQPVVREVQVVREEPVYRSEPQQIWVEPVYQLRTVPVEIPAVVRTRRIEVTNYYGQRTGYRIVREVIEPARVEYRTERVLVRAGYYQTLPTQVHVTRPVTYAPRGATVVYDRPANAGFSFGFNYGKRESPHHHRRPLIHRALRAALRH